MKYRPLSPRGPLVSELALGTWQTIGQRLDQHASTTLVHAALDLGITLFDTADVYGDGAAERALGLALRDVARERFAVATKCFFPWPSDATARGLSRTHVIRVAERSLRNLGTDAIDLLQCHRFDPDTPLEETCAAMAELVRTGKVRHWGVGRFTAAQLQQVMKVAEVPPVGTQHFLNALNREAEAEILPACRELGLGFLAYSPLAQGVLTGKYIGDSMPEGSRASGDARSGMWELKPESLMRAARWRDTGHSLVSLALGYVLSRAGVSSALVGASSVEQLRANVEALGHPPDAALLRLMETS